MGNDLVLIEDGPGALSLASLSPVTPLDRNPAAVYLASLPSPESRRTLSATLEVLAGLLSGGKASAARIPWGAVRYAHTAALRAALPLPCLLAASPSPHLLHTNNSPSCGRACLGPQCPAGGHSGRAFVSD